MFPPRKSHLLQAALFLAWALAAPAGAAPSIEAVRHGHYPEESRTRVVIDCSSRPIYSVAARSSYVVVTILDAKIATERELPVTGVPERVRVEPVGNGAAVIITFKNPVQVSHFCEPPSEPYPHHRIVLDFRLRRPPSPPAESRKCIVIDPGHGGWNNGAEGSGRYSYLLEKDIVLDVARRVHDLFAANDTAGKTALFLTRTTDVLPFLPNGRPEQGPPLNRRLPYRRRDLLGRVRFAEEKASLFGRDNTVFVSLHVNWAPNSRAQGFQVYVANDEAVARGQQREIEARENAGDRSSPLDPRVARLLRSRALETSTFLARCMLADLDRIRGMEPYGRDGGLHHANFLVLQTLDCPAVLVEMAFLSNSGDSRRLADQFFREDLGRSVYNSIVTYFKRRDPAFTLPLLAPPTHLEYTVRSGDTLVGIASKFNTDYRAIMRLNGLRSATIHPGQVLRIPA